MNIERDQNGNPVHRDVRHIFIPGCPGHYRKLNKRSAQCSECGHIDRLESEMDRLARDGEPCIYHYGESGWSVNVWFGSSRDGGVITDVRRYVYATRAQARAGDIGDDIGVRGRIA